MVDIQFVLKTYEHDASVQIYSGNEQLLTNTIQPNTVSSFTSKITIPNNISVASQGGKVMVVKFALNNFTIDVYQMFPKLVNHTSDNYQVHIHNNVINFEIDESVPAKWLMKNHNQILISRVADYTNDVSYTNE